MDVQAIHVSLTVDDARFEGTAFPDPKPFLMQLRAKGGRHVLLVSETRAEELARLEVVLDQGVRDPTSDLTRRLIGKKDKIPLIRVRYSTRNRLIQGLEAFLARATGQRDQNVYLLAIADDVFADWWDEYGVPLLEVAEESGPNGGAPPRAVDSATPDRPSASGPPAGGPDLWQKRLARITVPEQVERRFIGVSRDTDNLRRQLTLAAASDEPVLILGETGTGKDVVADLIHRVGDRCRERFVAVNCAEIPAELLEAELFGATNNAASNLSARLGLWRAADGGTLFLDEVAELSKPHQAKILRAVERNEIRPVGASEWDQVDVRVIAATNRDLHEMVKRGEFREDLFFRLKGFWIQTRPLREHPEDVGPLANWYWKKFTKDPHATLPVDVIEVLASDSWPGNVREMRQVLVRLASLCSDDYTVVDADHAWTAFHLARPDHMASSEALADPRSRALVRYYREIRLAHLRRIDEVLSGLMWTIKPIVRNGNSDAATPEGTLRKTAHLLSEGERLLDQFEELCHEPSTSLPHPESPAEMRHLLQVLRDFYRVLQVDVDRAAKIWRKTTYGHFRLALTTIHRDVNELLG